ncbi:hypothetical protein [Nocardia abscessus]|uniref:hypothetical protein n=1 Tax=Nocardia abscessus TaxID=120957 RepID=UPI002458A68C|nr:hypothetical protein [Nocardia abscessus]
MSADPASSTITAALHAARALIDANDASAGGLVIVLLSAGRPVTVLWAPQGETDPATIAAAARLASAAVVIAVGALRAHVMGPILARLDALLAQLSAAGISDPAAVQVSSPAGDKDTAVTDLTHARDRVVPAPTSQRIARRWGRFTTILGRRRARRERRRA